MNRKLALIIGNSKYEDTRLARLVMPDVDVEAMKEVLQDPQIGGFDDVTALVNEPGDSIRRSIARFFAEKKRSDLLLLYFSGHGVRDDRGDLYLAVKDTELNLLSGTAIPASYITGETDRSRSQRQVLILDCCHSGAFARGAKGTPGARVGTATAFKGAGYGRVVLTATDSTQYAWEGDEVTGEGENSVFTYYLIQGLKTGEADADGDGRITLDELYDYVYERVKSETPRQTPGKWTYRQQGELVIARNPQPVIKPAELPSELQQTIEDSRPWVREGALHELTRLLNGGDKRLALAARKALERLRDDDSRRVSAAAAESLAAAAPEAKEDVIELKSEKEAEAEAKAKAEAEAAKAQEEPKKIVVDKVFATSTFSDAIIIASAVLLGMLSSLSINISDSLRIDLTPLQVLFVFLVAYRYGKELGAVSGSLIFLPNLCLYYIGGPHPANIFFARSHLSPIMYVKGFSIIAYVIYGFIGYFIAVLKKKLKLLEIKLPFIDSTNKFTSTNIYFVLIPAYVFCFLFRFGPLTIEFYTIVSLILLGVSFYYGFKKATILILCCIPFIITNIYLGQMKIGGFYSGANLFWILMTLVIAGYLNMAPLNEREHYSKFLFITILFIGFIISFKISISRHFSLTGYPFSLSLVLLSGFIFGPKRGFWLGLLWGFSSIIYYRLSPTLSFFGHDWFFVQAAPIIGYLGGSVLLNKNSVLHRGITLFTIFYSCLIVVLAMNGASKIEYYLPPIISLVQSLICLSIFYPILKRFQKNNTYSSQS